MEREYNEETEKTTKPKSVVEQLAGSLRTPVPYVDHRIARRIAARELAKRYRVMLSRFKMIASSYLLLIRDGNILLSRRFNTGYEDGKYSLPAGHVEEGESLREAGAREFFEEIGVRIQPKDLSLVHVMHRRENDIRMDVFFTAGIGDKKPVNKEPKKCDDLRWFPLNNLPANTIPYIRHAIACYQEKILYSEFGWE